MYEGNSLEYVGDVSTIIVISCDISWKTMIYFYYIDDIMGYELTIAFGNQSFGLLAG